MAESLISQLLKKGQEPDPLANIGQGGYGLQQPQNPIIDAANVVGEHLTPEYLKNPNVHGLAPNENWKTPRSQPDNPLPWLAPDLASAVPAGAAKVAAPFMKSMFFGPLAKTANLAKLAKAKEMTAEGADKILRQPLDKYAESTISAGIAKRDRQIYDETGWFRRPDSKWRTPISDEGAYGSAIGFELGKDARGVPLDRVLKHNKLYEGYPEFKDIQFNTLPDNANFLGAYHPEGIMGAKFRPNPGRTSTLLHEGSHAIQGVEDFAPGSSPAHLASFGKEILEGKGLTSPYSPEVKQKLDAAAFNLYQRHSGEDEARLVQRLFEAPPEMQKYGIPYNNLVGRSSQVVPGDWLAKQTPETQEFVKNTMTHQFQGGPPTLKNYIKLLMQDAK